MSETSTKLEATAKLREKVNEGTITLKDLVETFASDSDAPTETPSFAPAVITDEQRAALDRLPEVFGRIMLGEPVELEPEEMRDLHIERDTLDIIEKMAKGRKDDIRSYLLHHFSLVNADKADELARDKDGHLVPSSTVRYPIQGTDKDWSLEPRKGTANFEVETFKRLAEDPEVEDVTYDDYLAVTEQTRVFSEHKAMLHLKKNPKVMDAMAKAVTERGTPSITVTTRKHKK